MGEIDPHCTVEQDTLQLIPLLLASLLAVPVRRIVEPVGTVAVLGDTDTAIAGGGDGIGDGEAFPPPPPQAARQTKGAAATSLAIHIGIPQCNAYWEFKYVAIRNLHRACGTRYTAAAVPIRCPHSPRSREARVGLRVCSFIPTCPLWSDRNVF